jgi:hypothetical protein
LLLLVISADFQRHKDKNSMGNWDYGRINRWGCAVDQPEPCEDFGIVVFSRRRLWLWREVGFMVVGVEPSTGDARLRLIIGQPRLG